MPVPIPPHPQIQFSSPMREKQADILVVVYLKAASIFFFANGLGAWIILMGHFAPVFYKPWELSEFTQLD